MLLTLVIGSLLSSTTLVLSSPLLTAKEEQQQQQMCLDTNYESFHNKDVKLHTWIPCEPAKKSNTDLFTSFLRFEDTTESAPFDISFKCFHTTDITCQKAERAFKKAGDMISSVIFFREPVKVNATLASFCKMGNECGKNMMTLGGSSPARSIPLLNDDGVMRLHPQSLVKQFMLDDHPEFAEYDILSVFNADAPYWFEEDGIPIDSNQADFTFVILHEFMHGLGFYSGWNEYIAPKVLTPDPSAFLANQIMHLVNPAASNTYSVQFMESVMDRLMSVLEYDEQNKATPIFPVSEYTRQINKAHASSVNELLRSQDFLSAKEMSHHATQAGSLGLDISEDMDPIVLETSLHPFQPGSSISHVDYKLYTESPDFLMRFMQDRGLTLTEAIKRAGGDGPIGPLLLKVFEEIGYSTISSPNTVPPLLIYQQEGMDDFVMNELQSTNHGVRRKHQHHRNRNATATASYQADHAIVSIANTNSLSLYQMLLVPFFMTISLSVSMYF